MTEPTNNSIVVPKLTRLTTGHTIPLMDATTEEEFLVFFRHNIAQFPRDRYKLWLASQPAGIRKVATVCPPWHLYRLVAGEDGRLAAISGYKDDGSGSARIALVILGEEAQQFVEPSWLRVADSELEPVAPIENYTV